MSYRIALSLRVIHEYWGAQEPPIQLRFEGFGEAKRRGLGMRAATGGRVLVHVDESVTPDPDPMPIDIGFYSRDPDLRKLTEGYDWDCVPLIDGDRAGDDIPHHTAIPLDRRPRETGDTPLMVLRVAIPASGTRDLTLRFGTVAALWAYHLVSDTLTKNAIRIVDDNEDLAFEDLGDQPLPDGRAARVLRSSQALPLHLRSNRRLRLEQDQPPPREEPLVLIPVLPVGGANLKAVSDPGAASPLQTDIFVSL